MQLAGLSPFLYFSQQCLKQRGVLFQHCGYIFQQTFIRWVRCLPRWTYIPDGTGPLESCQRSFAMYGYWLLDVKPSTVYSCHPGSHQQTFNESSAAAPVNSQERRVFARMLSDNQALVNKVVRDDATLFSPIPNISFSSLRHQQDVS